MLIENHWLLMAIGAACVVGIMFVLWLVGIACENFSYVDIGWSANFAVLGFLYAALAPGTTTLSAIGSPVCTSGACPQFRIAFSITIVVG